MDGGSVGLMCSHKVHHCFKDHWKEIFSSESLLKRRHSTPGTKGRRWGSLRQHGQNPMRSQYKHLWGLPQAEKKSLDSEVLLLKVLNGNWGIFCKKYSLVKKFKEFKTQYELCIYLGESDGTTTRPFPWHQGAQGWFLRCLICLCSLCFQVRTLSDLHLKVLRSILAWLLLQIMGSQMAMIVTINTIDGEANWKSLRYFL